jgi:hypothetical protein
MGRGCPGPERLAEYADGVLEPGDRADIERHLVDCADCRAVIGETMAFLQAHPVAASPNAAVVVPFRSRRWVTGVVAGLAAAAVLALAVRIVRPQWVDGLFGPRGDRPELEELIAALASEPTRPVHGRLTGGFKYAPPPTSTRGPENHDVSPEVRIAAAHIEASAQRRPSAQSSAAVGVAYLVVGGIDRAISALERASELDPSDAGIQNDLAVAYLERGQRFNRRDDLERALVAAQAALALSPAMKEAAFNRALAYQSLENRVDSIRAWEMVRRLDPTSPWTLEALEGRPVPAAR